MKVSSASQDTHPFIELLILIFYAVLGALFSSFIAIIFFIIAYKSGDFNYLLELNALMNDINFLRITQIFSSAGIFVLGPFLYARVRKYSFDDYFHFNHPVSMQLFVLAFALMLVSAPLLEFVVSLNNKMSFPESLQEIEFWMKAKELEAAELTKKLLFMNSYADLALNLLMIAVLPAIGEELLFRGAMQNIFTKWFYNPHIAIWITAIIFSAIHVQFYGFFPRMLLGALFGYMLVWSRSLWLPIFGHFLNNGFAVLMAFVLQQRGKSIDEIEKTDTFQTSAYAFSAIFTLALLIAFYRQCTKEKSLAR